MTGFLLRWRSAKARGRDEGDREGGFTLVELLVAMTIVGTMGATAVPAYQYCLRAARNQSAASDTSNAVTVMEQCLLNSPASAPSVTTDSADPAGPATIHCGSEGTGASFTLSSGNTMTLTVDGNGYRIATTPASPGDRTSTFSSETGQATTG